jgi:hypothetical protein
MLLALLRLNGPVPVLSKDEIVRPPPKITSGEMVMSTLFVVLMFALSKTNEPTSDVDERKSATVICFEASSLTSVIRIMSESAGAPVSWVRSVIFLDILMSP